MAEIPQKISELVELASPATTDILVIVDDPAGGAATKKVSVANLLATGVSFAALTDTDTTGLVANDIIYFDGANWVRAGGVTWNGDQLLMQLDNDPTAPTLAFGDGDTGIYESADDILSFALAGVRKWQMNADAFQSDSSVGPALRNEGASSTNPTFTPRATDVDSGIGWPGDDELSLIAGGVELLRLVESGLAATDQLIIGPAGIIGAAATPALAFGDGDTGIFEDVDDQLVVALGGLARWYFNTSFMGANVAGKPRMNFQTPSDTVPTLLPDAGDGNTGIGAQANDVLSLVAGGVEAMRLAEASGAVILSYQSSVGLTADVGSAQGNGVILSSHNVYSTVGTTGDAATLPAVFPVGTQIYVKNDGANSMDVFPASGDDAGGGVDTAVAVASGSSATFIATATDATWTPLIVGGGGLPSGTVEGEMLYWDQVTDQEFKIATSFLWDEPNSKLFLGNNFTIEDDGGTPGSTGITSIKGGTGVKWLEFNDAGSGGTLLFGEQGASFPTFFRFQSRGTTAGSGRLNFYSSGGGIGELYATHTNNMYFNGTGVNSWLFEGGIAIEANSGVPGTAIDGITLYSTFQGHPLCRNTQNLDYGVLASLSMVWRFNNPNDTTVDPAAMFFRNDQTTITGTTQLAFDDLNGANTGDAGHFFSLMHVGDMITVQQLSHTARWGRFTVDAITDKTGWWQLDVTEVDFQGAGFVNSEDCQVTIHPRGDTAAAADYLPLAGGSMDAGSHTIFPLENDATTPTLAFGDGDTGFYESADDELSVAFIGTQFWIWTAAKFGTANQTRPGMISQAPTSTIPNLVPRQDDPNTGIGWQGPDALSLIAGGVEMLRLQETGTATTDQLIIGPAGVIGAKATPSLAFGDGDSGFYEAADDEINLSLAGTDIITVTAALMSIETALDLSNNVVDQARLKDYCIESDAPTVSANAVTLAYSDGPAFEVDMEPATAAIVITISGGPPANTYGQITVKVQQDGSTAQTLSFTGGTIVNAGGTLHPVTTTLDGITIYTLETWDTGTTWYVGGADYS